MGTKVNKTELLEWLKNVEDNGILLQIEAVKNQKRPYQSHQEGEENTHTVEEPKNISEMGRITFNPEICNGKPTIRGKRITVQTILEFLSAGDSIESILEQYPSLEAEDIAASLKFASALMENSYEIKPLYG